ncbi:ABC transporter permease [Xylanibacillus composti]|uniref:ABC-2 type transporter transmembrane domain-containing protein n=1 Tax=Xylanibacillus composti TaxID=1572762 RepID=A0A8J4H4A6_9BACL|nr:ABC transporter permease [Xylanibacillus composti]MDT9726161.1 ABC transporter permease [Xylanibacillus composti]GIQ70604.1 hypothetical protein XYCOK13_34280 [Xylanibacillus composti]
MTVFQFVLKRSFRNVTNLIFLTLFPAACIFLPQGDPWPLLPYGYQFFGILLLFVSIRLTLNIQADRATGVMKRLSVAPLSHFRYLSQNLLAYLLIIAAQCTLVVYGGVLYGQPLYQPFLLLILYISYSLAALAVALAWVSFFRNKDVAFFGFVSLVFLVAVLGGLMIPVSMFPEWLARIAVLFPTYWLAEGQNWIVFGGKSGEFLFVNVILWIYAIVFMIIGSMRKIH